MNNTLKTLSASLCKPVMAGLSETPKSHVFTQEYTKPSLITAMYHVMGFDGKKLERVANVNEQALRKYCFFLIRPFYHSINVSIYLNTGKAWEYFGKITRQAVNFAPKYQAVAFKAIPNEMVWRNKVQATGIVQLKPPVVDTLPTMTDIIRRFGCLLEQGELGEFALATLDGMTRSGNLPTYVRAAMSVLHFNVETSPAGIVLTSDIEGSTIQIQFTEMNGKAPIPEHLKDNAKISESLKSLREGTTDDYADFYDIVMLRAVKNTLVIVPFDKFKTHSITMTTESSRDLEELENRKTIHIDAYMRMKDTRADQKYLRIYSTIEVKE